MKKFVSLILVAIGLTASASAAVVIGGSAGYLIDSEEEYFTARLGYEFNSTTAFAHQAEIEFGYTESKESGVFGSIAPLTANYRFLSAAGEKFSYHVGAGAGVAQVKVEVGSTSTNSQPFVAQAFAGVDYRITPSLSINLDAKYLWIDDVELYGITAEVGDDVALSAGISFKF